MRALAVLLLVLGGCAAQQDVQVATADCKIAPATTRGFVGKPGPTTELDRRWAEAQLASTGYRRRELEKWGPSSTMEQALDDCR